MKRDNATRDVASVIARAALGMSIAAHGAQKLFGWFEGPGPDGTAQFMKHLGFEPPEQFARLSSASEIAAGVLIATGALGPVGPMLLTSVMTTAAGSVHISNGYFNDKKGIELNAIYAIAALLLAVNDYGRISFDHVTGLRGRTSSLLGVAGVAAGVAAGIYVLSQRRATQPDESSSSSAQTSRPAETGTIEPSSASLDAVE